MSVILRSRRGLQYRLEVMYAIGGVSARDEVSVQHIPDRLFLSCYLQRLRKRLAPITGDATLYCPSASAKNCSIMPFIMDAAEPTLLNSAAGCARVAREFAAQVVARVDRSTIHREGKLEKIPIVHFLSR